MAAKHWPAFQLEPEWQRELEAAEADALAEAWEDEMTHRENVRLGFEENAA